MKPFDCHTHLYDDAFSKDFDEVLQRAKKVLSGIIVVGEGPESNRRVLALCKAHKGFLFPGLAIQPDQVHLLTDAQIDKEIEFIRGQKNLVCIGECGLDYLWAEKSGKPEETKQRQQETFEKLIKLADEMGLPLNIHSRRATKPVVETLEKLKPKRAILHGWSGTIDETKRAVKLGYKIAIATNIFYSPEKLEYIKHLPLLDLVLETDSPVLAAVKGERNEPANITLVVKEIAKIKNMPEKEVISATNNNIKDYLNIF